MKIPHHIRDVPLLGFRIYCDQSNLPKKILDCGAGGATPPLRIFQEQGYDCYGIELARDLLNEAIEYAKANNIPLKISEGDMRNLPFEDNSFSFVYSHHSLFHMIKSDIHRAISEMKRVLIPNGLLFVNLPAMKKRDLIDGKEIGTGEFGHMHGIEGHIHSYFEDDEADSYFGEMEMVHKMKWVILKSTIWDDEISMIDYILRK